MSRFWFTSALPLFFITASGNVSQSGEELKGNALDVYLLNHDPHKLLEHYQPTIEIIVKKYIARGLFRPQEKDDVVQTINEKLLSGKIAKIQNLYNHTCYLSTYFSKIVSNLCLEIKRRHKTVPYALSLDEVEPGYQDERADNALMIRDELNRFDRVLRMYYRSRPKLTLCLKLIFHIPLTETDIRDYYPDCPVEDQQLLTERFGHDRVQATEKEVYAAVTPLFNQCEQKRNSPDALRKWLNARIDEVITLLNAGGAGANYDKPALKLLVEQYYTGENREAGQ